MLSASRRPLGRHPGRERLELFPEDRLAIRVGLDLLPRGSETEHVVEAARRFYVDGTSPANDD